MDFSAEFYETALAGENETMKKTKFDRYLEEQLQYPAFAARFERAGEAWDMALQAVQETAGADVSATHR